MSMLSRNNRRGDTPTPCPPDHSSDEVAQLRDELRRALKRAELADEQAQQRRGLERLIYLPFRDDNPAQSRRNAEQSPDSAR